MELRKDYLLDHVVFIATERAKRPHQFSRDTSDKKPEVDFFAKGNEKKTPEEIYRVSDENGEWKIRVFPNLFAAVGKSGNPNIIQDNLFYSYADAIGKHEIVVETPNIDQQFWDLSKERIKEVLDVFIYRTKELQKLKETKYVVIFKNHKQEAGTSIYHTHWQIVSINIIPPNIEILENKATEFKKNHNGECAYCEIIKKEKDSFRKILQTEHTTSFTPYASRFIMESWIFTKRHVISINELNEAEKNDIALQLKTITEKLKKLNAPFNILFIQGTNNLHFHIQIIPRLGVFAGFEFETGIYINPISPEDAAKFYRGEE